MDTSAMLPVQVICRESVGGKELGERAEERPSGPKELAELGLWTGGTLGLGLNMNIRGAGRTLEQIEVVRVSAWLPHQALL